MSATATKNRIDAQKRLDLCTEDLITLNQACKEFPKPRGRNSISFPTVYRYTTKGRKGVVLESVKIGRDRLTTKQAVTRFLLRINSEA